MDDGELGFSNEETFLIPDMGEIPSSCYMDDLFDDTLFSDALTCTHTHTCNPPGPDLPHTHTCYHVHTKILPASEDVAADNASESSDKKSKKREPLGNREAVRKYREKRKARAASLEDEVVRLRALNQQLLTKLQRQAALEAENARLKYLLVDIRGRVEGELGCFPYQKSVNAVNLTSRNVPNTCVLNPCNLQCSDQVNCLHQGADGKCAESAVVNGQGPSSCEFGNLQCLANQDPGMMELPSCRLENMMPNGDHSGESNSKGIVSTSQ